MGYYEGAELSELVGSFILNKLTSIVNKSNIGLYRDDDLGIFYNVSKPEIERKKKVCFKRKWFQCVLQLYCTNNQQKTKK